MRRVVRLCIASFALTGLLGGCERSGLPAVLETKPARASAVRALPSTAPGSSTQQARRAATETERPTNALTLRVQGPTPGLEIAIEASVLHVGSPTGSAHRNPAREADGQAISIGPFAIDALPYPNDPAQPPRSGLSKLDAEKACASEGKRLCSELEWELACKGRMNAVYPSGAAFDGSACSAASARCYSDRGVFALGTLGREWTSSPARNGDWDRMRTVVVRGAPKNAAAPLHRCAARDAAAPESRSETLLFRCCRGAPPREEYPIEPELSAFQALTMPNEATRKVLRAMPETAGFAESFHLHAESALSGALTLAGKSAQSLAPWRAASAAFRWSPLRGEELVLLSGDTQAGALIVAYYPTAQGPRYAGSYLTRAEHVPILLAYKEDTRDELLYSTCWGCGGEGGALRLDASARLRFLPR